MEIKIFNGKKIKILNLLKGDLRNVKKFQEFINSLIEEDAQIILNKKFSLKEEKEWLKRNLKETEKQKRVFLIAEEQNRIVGTKVFTLVWVAKNT